MAKHVWLRKPSLMCADRMFGAYRMARKPWVEHKPIPQLDEYMAQRFAGYYAERMAQDTAGTAIYLLLSTHRSRYRALTGPNGRRYQRAWQVHMGMFGATCWGVVQCVADLKVADGTPWKIIHDMLVDTAEPAIAEMYRYAMEAKAAREANNG